MRIEIIKVICYYNIVLTCSRERRTMEVEFFCLGSKTSAEAYIRNLSRDEFVDVSHVIQLLSQKRFSVLGVKRWHGKILEVYFKRHNRLFFTIKHNKIYILYACRKMKQKTTKKDKTNILRIYKLFTQYVS